MNKTKVLTGFFWRFAERCGAQLVTFIVSIVLARILQPEVYGTIALVLVFTSLLNVFVDGGMANALVQKKDADDLDFSSVFYFNLFLCLLLYLGMYIAAPLIAAFYHRPELIAVVRVLSITIIVSGIKNVQQAYVSRTMQFKRFFFATIGGTLGAAVVGITMAYMGMGVWALVGQHLFNLIVDTLVLWITVKWRPKRMFSISRLKVLFSYGWKLLVSSILDTGYNNIRQLLIGRLYSSADLAYYNRGIQFPQFVIMNVNTSIDSVLLPAMSREQDHVDRIKSMTSRAIMTSTCIMSPIMIGLMACAEPLIRLILTEKWLPCVPYMRIFCFCFIFYPIHTANLNAMKSLGRSDLFLKLEIFKKISGISILCISIPLGLWVMTLSLIVETVIGMIINTWPNKKLIGYSIFEQLKDIFPSIACSVIMGLLVYQICGFHLSPLITLILQIITGALIYLAECIVFKIEAFIYLINILKTIVNR